MAKNTGAKGGAKNTGAKGAKLGAASGEMVMFTITPEFLAANPDYKEKGFEVGQEVEVPKALVDALDAGEEVEDAGRSDEDEASMKAEATGSFIVRPVEGVSGGFRLYNEHGQAVSPICTENEEIQKINKAASRSNALCEARKIGPQGKKAPAPTVQ